MYTQDKRIAELREIIRFATDKLIDAGAYDDALKLTAKLVEWDKKAKAAHGRNQKGQNETA